MKLMHKWALMSLIAGFTVHSASAIAEDELIGLTWDLVEIQSMNDTTATPPAGKTFSIQLTEEGQALVQADCNRGTGSFTLDGNSLQFGPMAVTKMLCGPDAFDNRFLNELSYVRSFVFRDGNLFMATMADGSILEFSIIDESLETVKTSFDCTHADGSVEEAICHNSDLAALDLELAEVYKKAQETFPIEDLKMLKAYQNGWIKGRNECWKADDLISCVTDEYEIRITQLQVKTGAFMVPGSVDYKCDDGDALQAFFYFETQRPSVVINKADNQVIAIQTATEEGATTYETANVKLVHQGPEVDLTWMEDTTHCKIN